MNLYLGECRGRSACAARGARRLLAAVLLATLVAAAHAADDLAVGTMLGPDTWRQAEGLLPPEILKHYEKGEYQNGIYEWAAADFNWPEDFKTATDANGGRYDVGEHGEVIEVASGKQPQFIIGFPFPKVDSGDPKAGAKILWNHLYRTWYFGNLRAESQLNMTSATKLSRRLDVDVSFMYYDGVTEEERVENPQNFLYQNLVLVTSPADVNGTAALTWRYRDPTKRDSAWTYVPALRRVRAVSPANRSDGFLGSDQAQDDGPFFDGKPEDFTWKLVREVDQLRFVDPLNLEGKSGNVWLEGGGWRANWPDQAFIGYMDPEWKGVAWAPTTAGLAKRRFYVVEGVPNDRYYLFGKLEFYIDAVTFQGAWSRKFSWKGELLNSFQVMGWNPHTLTRPDGKKDWVQGSNQAYQTVEAIKLNRATIAGIKSSPKSGFDGRITFDPKHFDFGSLSRSGK